MAAVVENDENADQETGRKNGDRQHQPIGNEKRSVHGKP